VPIDVSVCSIGDMLIDSAQKRQSNAFQVQEATPCLNLQRRRFRTL